jgi:probable rRNA maturation factor
VISGDLFVSVDRVRENALGLGVAFEHELNRVVIHGVMHLCGYGDKSNDESLEMRKKEDYYLNEYKGFT